MLSNKEEKYTAEITPALAPHEQKFIEAISIDNLAEIRRLISKHDFNTKAYVAKALIEVFEKRHSTLEWLSICELLSLDWNYSIPDEDSPYKGITLAWSVCRNVNSVSERDVFNILLESPDALETLNWKAKPENSKYVSYWTLEDTFVYRVINDPKYLEKLQKLPENTLSIIKEKIESPSLKQFLTIMIAVNQISHLRSSPGFLDDDIYRRRMDQMSVSDIKINDVIKKTIQPLVELVHQKLLDLSYLDRRLYEIACYFVGKVYDHSCIYYLEEITPNNYYYREAQYDLAYAYVNRFNYLSIKPYSLHTKELVLYLDKNNIYIPLSYIDFLNNAFKHACLYYANLSSDYRKWHPIGNSANELIRKVLAFIIKIKVEAYSEKPFDLKNFEDSFVKYSTYNGENACNNDIIELTHLDRSFSERIQTELDTFLEKICSMNTDKLVLSIDEMAASFVQNMTSNIVLLEHDKLKQQYEKLQREFDLLQKQVKRNEARLVSLEEQLTLKSDVQSGNRLKFW